MTGIAYWSVCKVIRRQPTPEPFPEVKLSTAVTFPVIVCTVWGSYLRPHPMPPCSFRLRHFQPPWAHAPEEGARLQKIVIMATKEIVLIFIVFHLRLEGMA